LVSALTVHHTAIFLDARSLTQVSIFVSTATECNTHKKSVHTVSLSFSLSRALTVHFYSDHCLFRTFLSGGIQSSPYASGLQSPLLVFDFPSSHFILLLCECVGVLPYYVFLFLPKTIFASVQTLLFMCHHSRDICHHSGDMCHHSRDMCHHSHDMCQYGHYITNQSSRCDCHTYFFLSSHLGPHTLQSRTNMCPSTERRADGA
jgi:hypothetical protein